MKKLLIMGGSYFIGKRIVDVCKDSFDVYVLNRGNKPINDPKVTELIANRNLFDEMKEALGDMKFDYIVDVSGLNQMHEEILVQTINLENILKFVFISSSAVYNIKKLIAPFQEDEELGGESPFADYAKNKIEAEKYLSSVISKQALVVLRPPVVYGAENYVLRERLIFKMIEEEMNIYIPKSNNRIQFVYATDLAMQIKDVLFNRIPSGIYNVGNQSALHFDAWVHLCEEVVGKKGKIVFVDTDKHQIETRSFFPFFDYDNILDVEKIRKYSQTETQMIDGLKEAFIDYQKNKEIVIVPDKMMKAFEELNQIYKNSKNKEII